tara:strand:- start:148 stop:543 length:396 start_codon:yes stop_codon:yes gene_type:complete
MKIKIYSILISLVVIPLFAIGQALGLLIGKIFSSINYFYVGGSLFTELAPYLISGAVAGGISGFVVIKFYKKYILNFAMIIPSFLTLVILYYVFTQIGIEGWSFKRVQDLAQQITTIVMYYYILKESEDFI